MQVEASQVEEAWVELLAGLYRAFAARTAGRTRRSLWDVFEHRVAFARYGRDVDEVVQRLCNYLSLQLPSALVTGPLDVLRRNQEAALDAVRRRHKVLAALAVRRARQQKEGGEAEGGGGGEA